MSGVKMTNYVDVLAKQTRAENLDNIKTALEVVEAEHNTMIATLGQLRRRIHDAEDALHRLDRRVDRLEHGGGGT